MRSRRSVPWIHRWSRPLIGVIAIIGAILTAYLTYVKLTGGEVACGVEQTAKYAASTCNDVLSSPYATVLGLPLSLFGLTAYLSMAAFALSPFLIKEYGNKTLRKQWQDWTWLLLLAGSTAMTVFSGYLMYVLFFKLQTVCYYCISSALFALTMFLLTVLGRHWEDLGQIFFTGVIVATLTIVGTLGVYAHVNSPEQVQVNAEGKTVIPLATTTPKPPDGWQISTTSTEAEIALAQHLKEIGAKKYGAFWCPHCYEQKQLFGKKAFAEIDYVECDPRGKNPQPKLCLQAGIKSYPTWKIKDQTYPGTQTLEKLAEVSGYQGSQEFKYSLP